MTDNNNKVKAWLSQLVDHNEKPFSKQWFISYSYIFFGTLLFVIADVLFAVPYHLAPGGVYGLANVLTALTGTKLFIFLICMEVPLLIIGSVILGPRFGVKTIFSVALGWLFTGLIESTVGYLPVIHVGDFFDTMQDGALKVMSVENKFALPRICNFDGQFFMPDYLISTLLAGVLYGIGIGLIFKSGATSGGSDIISMIINKYTHISLGTLVIIVDGLIALSCVLITSDIDGNVVRIQSLREMDLRLPAYSILLIIIEGKIIDFVVEGVNRKKTKTVFVVTNNVVEVRDYIVNELHRGGTCFVGEGLYQGSERTMIYVTLNNEQFNKLKKDLKHLDPTAFINVMDSTETLGQGFKSITEE